jgi:hypothetical protein
MTFEMAVSGEKPMAKLHELLAAEKTPTGAFNSVYEETLKKFKNVAHFFDGHSKSLAMFGEGDEFRAVESQAREEKPVTTNVFETLEFMLELFGRAEDLQYQKNATNRKATGTVIFKGQPLLVDMPIDELLGLEARLTRLRLLFADVPTLDATKHWEPAKDISPYVWATKFDEENVKTEKTLVPITLKEASKEHPAQMATVNKDVVVGKFTTRKRSGAVTALQKADALKRIDELLVEMKQARMRANETLVEQGTVADVLVPLLLEPFRTSREDHQ